MAFPPEIVKEARKAAQEGRAGVRRATTFPGVFGTEPVTFTVAPEYVVVGPGPGGKPPPWCQCCGADLSKQRAISFEYDFFPNESRSEPATWYMCPEECKHIGMGVPKH